MSVAKRNNGYSVRWRDSAGRQCSQQVTLWRDAMALDAEKKRQRTMGELVTHERGVMSLEDFWPIWRNQYGKLHVTPRTLENYEVLWRTHLEKSLGSTRLRDLSSEQVSRLVSKLSEKLAPSSVRKVLAVLSSVLQRAVEWQYIGTNPVSRVRRPRLETREGIALTEQQVAELIEQLPDKRSATVVAMLAGTGLRPGELRALRWSDIKDASITVTRAASHDRIGPTKTQGKRRVEMQGLAAAYAEDWYLEQHHVRVGDLVFPSAIGGLWTDNGWRMWQKQVFTPAAEAAGFEGLVPYDLRHTFVSTLIAAGHDVYWIARQAGHSPMMTLTTYGHLFDSYLRQAA